MTNSSDYYRIPQTAKICGLYRTTIWNWVKAGKMTAFVTPGRHHMLLGTTIETLLLAQPDSSAEPSNSPPGFKTLLGHINTFFSDKETNNENQGTGNFHTYLKRRGCNVLFT